MPFFNKKIIGLDIADRTIELAELSKSGGKMKVESLSRLVLEEGVIENGRIKDEEKLLLAIKNLAANSRPKPLNLKEVCFSLPESQTYIHYFFLPKNQELGNKSLSKEDLEEAVQKEAWDNLPIDRDSLVFYYKIAAEKENGSSIMIAGFDREVVLEWSRFFKKAEIKIKYFDLEMLAVFRGLFNISPLESIVVIDLGERTTNLAAFDAGRLFYSHSINFAGRYFSQEIAKSEKISFTEAENKKISAGLSGGNEAILAPALDLIIARIQEFLKYFKNKTGKQANKIVLVGGSSQLRGLKEYFSPRLPAVLEMGDSGVFKNKESIFYLKAVGLALRGLFSEWENDPVVDLGDERLFGYRRKKEIRLPRLKSGAFFFSSGGGENAKLRFQVIVLAIIVIFGIGSFFAARWYKNGEREKKSRAALSQLDKYIFPRTILAKVPVAINPEEYTEDRVRGKIVEYAVNSPEEYENYYNSASEKLSPALKSGEAFWPEPINKPADKASIIFPFSVQWLVFSEKEVQPLFAKELEKMNRQGAEYILNGISEKGVERTKNQNIVFLVGEVNILLAEESAVFENGEESAVAEEAVLASPRRAGDSDIKTQGTSTDVNLEEKKVIISIKNTETGWLNARAGAGISFPIIKKIYPNEEYELLEKSGDWVKLKLSDNETGWVFGKYTGIK